MFQSSPADAFCTENAISIMTQRKNCMNLPADVRMERRVETELLATHPSKYGGGC
ncbi:hypothetical protein [Leyella stercorea]|uniref:hypothetical protein n=1 Tax=Leyella stercorea TaxID=363265 RepID=UPI004025544A